MPDATNPPSARELWQERIKNTPAPQPAVDTSKDVLAFMRDIFGDGVYPSKAMRREGEKTSMINTIEIDDLCLDVAAINAINFVGNINQYGAKDDFPIAVVGAYNGVAFRVSLDAETANKRLDVIPDCDPPPHPPTLRAYLTMLAIQKNPPENVAAITRFTPRGR